MLIAYVDGLKGFPDAIGTVFPNTKIQLCVVHNAPPQHEVCLLERPQGGGG